MESMILLSVVLGSLGLLAFFVLRALKASSAENFDVKKEDESGAEKDNAVPAKKVRQNSNKGSYCSTSNEGTNQEFLNTKRYA